jgi:hypothetical protein
MQHWEALKKRLERAHFRDAPASSQKRRRFRVRSFVWKQPQGKVLITVAPSTTTTAAARATVSAITEAATTAASATAFSFGARFVHVKCAATNLRSIQSGNRFFTVFVARHLHKTKTTGASGIAVGHNTDPVHLPIRFKELPQLIFIGAEAEIPYKNILHAFSSALLCRSASSIRRTAGWADPPENRDRSRRTVKCGRSIAGLYRCSVNCNL